MQRKHTEFTLTNKQQLLELSERFRGEQQRSSEESGTSYAGGGGLTGSYREGSADDASREATQPPAEGLGDRAPGGAAEGGPAGGRYGILRWRLEIQRRGKENKAALGLELGVPGYLELPGAKNFFNTRCSNNAADALQRLDVYDVFLSTIILCDTTIDEQSNIP